MQLTDVEASSAINRASNITGSIYNVFKLVLQHFEQTTIQERGATRLLATRGFDHVMSPPSAFGAEIFEFLPSSLSIIDTLG